MKSRNNGSFVFSRRFNDVFFGIIILTQVKELIEEKVMERQKWREREIKT